MTLSSRYSAAVLTISDSTSAGLREDRSGPTLIQLLESAGFTVVHKEVLPDNQHLIRKALDRYCSSEDIHCVVTTGGTGVGPNDCTPEATVDVLERTLPGMAEAMRMESLKYTPSAMLSRQMAGVAKSTLIINFPGREEAVRQCFEVVRPVLLHTVDLICGDSKHTEAVTAN